MPDRPSAETGLAYLTFATAIGPLTVRASERAVVDVRFDAPPAPAERGAEGVLAAGQARGDPWRLARKAQDEIEAYLRGDLREFSLPIEPQGSAFQRRVWALLCEIPYGSTVPYGEIARRLDNPGSSRAVGLACGANPIPLIVPCHRVLAAGGRLGGFGGGLPRKRYLLHLEALGRPPRQLSDVGGRHAGLATSVQQKLDL